MTVALVPALPDAVARQPDRVAADDRGTRPMQQRITAESSSLARPIHRACVVSGCPCGSSAPGTSVRRLSLHRERPRSVRATLERGASPISIDPAWHSVGLPIA
jgi:hypothetical protein